MSGWPDHSGRTSPMGWWAIILVTTAFAFGGIFGHDRQTRIIMGIMAISFATWGLTLRHLEKKEP